MNLFEMIRRWNEGRKNRHVEKTKAELWRGLVFMRVEPDEGCIYSLNGISFRWKFGEGFVLVDMEGGV